MPEANENNEKMENGDVSDLARYRVTGVPDTVYYIPDFITREEESYLLNQIERSPAPRWTQLSNRRLQNYGGVPHKNGMISEKIPEWLQKNAVDKVNRLSVFGEKSANHVLLNEYKPGQGIMPHLDGDLFYPTITTISIGSHTVINFYEPETDLSTTCRSWDDRRTLSLYIEPRSLLILQDTMYNTLLHGIQEISSDPSPTVKEYPNLKDRNFCDGSELSERGTRYSLTIRHVPKASKVKIRLGR
eukprot:TRINITY_DN8776_c0_g1_i14.p1 TRINITY_DN8776_c0_g1~~TRINITY_DN8776_c0_g1_i14.p1  ORF type:complete len:245 (+),score=12.06 TRINITY_DN8776_c0_g1_i14:33-767(+)